MKNYMTSVFSKTTFLTLTSIAITCFSKAEQVAPTGITIQDKIGAWGNPVFISLTLFALLLAIIATGLCRALLSIGKKHYSQNKIVKTIALIIVTTGFFYSDSGFAQSTAFSTSPSIPNSYYGLSAINFLPLILLIFIELFGIFILIRTINKFLNPSPSLASETVIRKKSRVKKLIDNLSALKPMELEHELIMQGHSYDGIQELDNGMPPWLKYMFVGTVVIAFGYLANYHVFRIGMLQTAEYEKAMSDAELQLEEYRKLSANNIDETNVKLLVDVSELKSGQEIYKANCVACHGKGGEGVVGPNLTDDYWKHGSSINDVFKTIKYGVIEKGMKSWQTDLTPAQMQIVGSYIKSLQGTNPANPKAPEGDLYSEVTTSVDSTGAKVDSTVLIKTDAISVVIIK